MTGIFESHAHYEDEAFDEDRDEVLKSLPENGIKYVVDVGSSIDTCHKIIELIPKWDYMLMPNIRNYFIEENIFCSVNGIFRIFYHLISN